MALKNDYSVADTLGFDKNSLQPGNAAFRAIKFKEKKNPGSKLPIIEITLELEWTANEEDKRFLGQTLVHAVFWGGPQGAMTTQQLKQFAKASGCKTEEWETKEMPLGLMLAGFLKLLVHGQYLVGVHIKAGTKSEKGKVNFLNWGKVLRTSPDTGAPCSDRPPDGEIPHSLIFEAIEATVPGEDEAPATGAGDDSPF